MREQSTFGLTNDLLPPSIVSLRQLQLRYYNISCDLPQDTNIQAILEDLMKGTEQLLFSFIVPSTFCSTDNIVELQKLVTQGGFLFPLFFTSVFLVSRLQ